MILTDYDRSFVEQHLEELQNISRGGSVSTEIRDYLKYRFHSSICIGCNRSIKEHVTNLINTYYIYDKRSL